MLLLDHWNEWGEGHYLAPYREYSLGYLDAIRKVVTDAAVAHRDLIPEDIGRGPYDTATRKLLKSELNRNGQECGDRQPRASAHRADATQTDRLIEPT